MLLSCQILSKFLLNSSRLGGCFCFLMQPYGNGFIIAWPYWLFSSIFSIFVKILFVCFLPSIFKSSKTFSFLLSSSKISVSKASCGFTQLKPPIYIFLNILTCSASVGSAIWHLLLSLWTHLRKELAELHFQGLYLKSFCRWTEHRSNISQSIMVSWKMYILLSSPRFPNFIVW